MKVEKPIIAEKPFDKPKEYPECLKFRKAKEESQSIGLFIDWLKSKNIVLARWAEETDDEESSTGLYEIGKSTESLLMEYFKIDLNKLEQERRQILSDFIKSQEKK